MRAWLILMGLVTGFTLAAAEAPDEALAELWRGAVPSYASYVKGAEASPHEPPPLWRVFLQAHTPPELMRARAPVEVAAFTPRPVPRPIAPAVRTSVLAVPAPRPIVLPAPLSDVALYQEIFQLQNETEWVMAETLTAELQDPLLLGHVLYERYVHPQAPRTSWASLRDWLKDYADLPQAWHIYRMAKARKPARARNPRKPPMRLFARSRSSDQLFTTSRARAIKRRVTYYCRKGRPTSALRYVSAARQTRRLSPEAQAALYLQISYSYYTLGYPQKASLAARRATPQRADLPMVDWHLGFAAWRLQDMEAAALHFAHLARHPRANDREIAKGAFWAARAFARLGQDSERTRHLEIAAQEGVNFYSLLARRQLERHVPIAWAAARSDGVPLDALNEHAAVRRALLLLEVGQPQLAERELLLLLERSQPEEITALNLFAIRHRLTAIELAAARSLAAMEIPSPQRLAPSLYPIPATHALPPLELDRALVFALIRQESLFRLTATSPAGARGLMQLMPATAAHVSGDNLLMRKAHLPRLYDATTNLHIGQAYLRQLLEGRYGVGANLMVTLGAYNAGPGAVRRWMRRLPHDDPLTFMESLPANETRLYISRVLENLWIYRQRLHQPTPSLDALAQDDWPLYQALDKAPAAVALSERTSERQK